MSRTLRAVHIPTAADVLSLVQSSLEGDKAEDIIVIDLAGKTSLADFMIVASGTSTRHIASMADHLLERLKRAGAPSVSVEGIGLSDWVLIDAGDVLVHLFRPEVRAFYALERLWGDRAAVRGVGQGSLDEGALTS